MHYACISTVLSRNSWMRWLTAQRIVTLAVVGLALCGACDSGPAVDSQPPPTHAADLLAAAPSKEAVPRPIIIVFTRDYCTPCQVMKPWIGELALQHTTVDVVSINVDRKANEHLGKPL